jgi:hypothetical protein
VVTQQDYQQLAWTPPFKGKQKKKKKKKKS